MATKTEFMAHLRVGIVTKYGHPADGDKPAGWANDPEHLNRFMLKVGQMLDTPRNLVSIDSPTMVEAWRAIGMKGKPTYKGLRALPD